MNKIVSWRMFLGCRSLFCYVKRDFKSKSGYVNGNKENPTYQEVCSGIATHAEATYLEYDESIISLEKY